MVMQASLAGDRPPVRVSPAGVSVRSRVHEYGGGSFLVAGGVLFYVESSSQAIWTLALGGVPLRITPVAPEGEEHRYADMRAVGETGWIVALRERHHRDGVTHELVALGAAGGGDAVEHAVVLASGRDFYAAPRPDPDGRRLAWTCWDHPCMPWDESELWIADIGAEPSVGSDSSSVEALQAEQALPALSGGRRIAGGAGVSVGQPTWGPSGELWFVSDAGGWWQPWRAVSGGDPELACGIEADFHLPDWVLGQATMAVMPEGELACRWRHGGRDHLGLLDPRAGELTELSQPCTSVAALCAAGSELVVVGATPVEPAGLYVLPARAMKSPRTGPEKSGQGDWGQAATEPSADGRGSRLVHLPGRRVLAEVMVSTPRPMVAKAPDGVGVPLLYYPPRGQLAEGMPGELPPLVVFCHGGPTSCTDPALDLGVQMFTTRGFAVAGVDYRGSCGYGRAYREMLRGNWGIADADDCIAAAEMLARSDLADPVRMVVRGASAGGFTALRAAARGTCFAAAVSVYGVTDLEALANDTHDFESRYLDGLLGALPDAASTYAERSPAHHPEEIKVPVLLLQGSKDPVVPPNQAADMAAALGRMGVRCDHVVFEGEGHGFRLAATMERAAMMEIDFVSDVLGL